MAMLDAWAAIAPGERPAQAVLDAMSNARAAPDCRLTALRCKIRHGVSLPSSCCSGLHCLCLAVCRKPTGSIMLQ